MNEKQQFADRLKTAMLDAGYEARASVLEKHFNSRYWGRSVTYHAARRWLIGLSIPEQEKLQVLAEWLGIAPQTLRFGTTFARDVGDGNLPCLAKLGSDDQAAFRAYFALTLKNRQLIRDMIAALHAE